MMLTDSATLKARKADVEAKPVTLVQKVLAATLLNSSNWRVNHNIFKVAKNNQVR
jgi:hypothetical protein